MTPRPSSLTLALFAVAAPALAASLPAQDATSDAADARSGPAKAGDHPTFVALRSGGTQALFDATGRELGRIRDHVFDPVNRDVLASAVEVGFRGEPGHRLVRVPFDSLRYEERDRRMVFSDPAGGLDALADFRVLDAGSSGSAGVRAEGSFARLDPHRPLSTAELVGSTLRAVDGDFGQVLELLADPATGKVVFAVVVGDVPSAHGLVYAMPFDALEWVPPTDPETRGRLVAGLSVAELCEAPKLERGSHRTLEHRRAVARVFEFFGLEAPEPGSDRNPAESADHESSRRTRAG